MISALSIGQHLRGHDVHVAAVLTASPIDHPFIERLRENGISTHVIVAGGRAYRTEWDSIRQLCVKLRPAVAHTHGYRADIVDGAAARAAEIPSVSTVHGFTGGGLRNRLNEHLQCWFLKRFEAVVAVSAPIRERLIRIGVQPAKVHAIPNAFSGTQAVLSRTDARAALGIGDDDRHVAFIGRLSPEKGPDILLEAVKQVDSRIKFSFIGDGRLRQSLEERTKALQLGSRVKWHGVMQDSGRFMRAFDLVVLSSRTEGTPIVLLEALAAGVPAIATSVGGIPDMVAGGEALLVPPEDPMMLAEAIDKALMDPAGIAKRVRAGLDLVRERFDTARWVEEYDRVYTAAALVKTGNTRKAAPHPPGSGTGA